MPSAPHTATAKASDQLQEFDRQLTTLIDSGYPPLAGLSTSAFRRLADPLRAGLDGSRSEGIAVVTHLPGILRERTWFSLLGSRCGDRRVTAVWVSKTRPKLGQCRAGNPRTWLGSASCGGRVTGSPGAVRQLAG
jgi:hypothetical protein